MHARRAHSEPDQSVHVLPAHRRDAVDGGPVVQEREHDLHAVRAAPVHDRLDARHEVRIVHSCDAAAATCRLRNGDHQDTGAALAQASAPTSNRVESRGNPRYNHVSCMFQPRGSHHWARSCRRRRRCPAALSGRRCCPRQCRTRATPSSWTSASASMGSVGMCMLRVGNQ